MADRKLAVAENVQGEWFVDESCINCGTCRHLAPTVFGDQGATSFVKAQPDLELTQAAGRALLSCPVGAIGTELKAAVKDARASLPLKVFPGVYHLGYTHRSSFGAQCYLAHSEAGSWMIDAPRFLPTVVRAIEELGGLAGIFLTHRDDVGDAAKFAAHFGVPRIIHRADLAAQPEAELVLDSEDQQPIAGSQIVHVPGHTRGCLCLHWEQRVLFTGDHLCWSPERQALHAFRGACWYSWEEQIESMRTLRDLYPVQFIAPGHGMWTEVEPREFGAQIDALLEWMA